ncbi:mitochondrial 37S ribosomal protein uS9m NDAI_0A06940 [Naumovozyma dairenensis CBS 421]|uniref:Small ribosomal subunit protein uS9m n=1 Tax=Naumovozyma dairenensis (strain ATCC 10597 / BCRC 20456 / CBS 421 / NBRC 0211 / NRRL Y-12639) TaxID=1071378 RepID=G0W4W0_NAUDC|nr:hypothetical protein NDAI_0A06940 [Naumovozyma dairenensis CBS 421]CCD22848.1 hypothetical protein NDAI_0A06940 [Naumovozyma dairenensis CBS 421]
MLIRQLITRRVCSPLLWNNKTCFSRSFTVSGFSNDYHKNTEAIDPYKRVVPKLSTFYSANPIHEDVINRLESLLRKYIKLPTIKSQPSSQLQQKRTSWLSFEDYALIGGGTRLKPIHYTHLLTLLNRLNNIDPQLTNDEIKMNYLISNKKSSIQANQNVIKTLDELGRSVAIGRRKAASAKVYVVRGQGDILVNGRQLNDYFVELKDRDSIMYPLRVIDSVGKYNIFATTSGGGPTGQAEAIMHAIGKALVVFNPLLKSRLHKSGVLSRDYRHVERKKPGKRKARKMPMWVKR